MANMIEVKCDSCGAESYIAEGHDDTPQEYDIGDGPVLGTLWLCTELVKNQDGEFVECRTSHVIPTPEDAPTEGA